MRNLSMKIIVLHTVVVYVVLAIHQSDKLEYDLSSSCLQNNFALAY